MGIMGDTSVQVMLWDVKETHIFEMFKLGVLKCFVSGLFAEGVKLIDALTFKNVGL